MPTGGRWDRPPRPPLGRSLQVQGRAGAHRTAERRLPGRAHGRRHSRGEPRPPSNWPERPSNAPRCTMPNRSRSSTSVSATGSTSRRAARSSPRSRALISRSRKADSRPFEYITVCPVCGTPLVRYEGEAKYYCPNQNHCEPQILGRIIHFIRRKAMDIDGLGEGDRRAALPQRSGARRRRPLRPAGRTDHLSAPHGREIGREHHGEHPPFEAGALSARALRTGHPFRRRNDSQIPRLAFRVDGRRDACHARRVGRSRGGGAESRRRHSRLLRRRGQPDADRTAAPRRAEIRGRGAPSPAPTR